MARIVARVKKWGSSLGVVIPAAVARAQALRAGDEVNLDIEPARVTMADVAAAVRPQLRGFDLQAALKDLEADTGWDDT